jgi:hypothetical protein
VRILLACCAGLAAACATGTSGTPAVSKSAIAVDGAVRARELTAADLEALGPREIVWNHKGAATTYRAVPLEAVLRAVGVEPGEMSGAPRDKRPGWKHVAVFTATDGFQSVFSAAELYQGMGRTEAWLALSASAQPAVNHDTPFRLLVTSDGEGSRSARDVQRLTVLDVRTIVPAPE